MGLFAKEYQGPPASLLPPNERSAHDALAARRVLRLFAVAVFVVVVGAVFAFTATRGRDDPPQASSPSGRTTATDPASGASSDGSIGPLVGADVGAYIEARRQALTAAAPGEGVAVVSLEGYKSEAEARAAVGSVKVEALLAAAPGAHPSVVTDGLEAWTKRQRQADESERAEIRKLLPTVDDPVFKEFYESEVVRLDTAIASVSPTSEIVFGLVVRGPTDALKALGDAPGVRLVDVGLPVAAGSGALFQGLRPEETTKVGQPATRPV